MKAILFLISLPVIGYYLFRGIATLILGKEEDYDTSSSYSGKRNRIVIKETNYITHNHLTVNEKEFHKRTEINPKDIK